MEKKNLNLNPVHNDLIGDFLRFSRYLQTQRLKSIKHSFSDFLSQKITNDGIYTGEEIRGLIEELDENVTDEVETELRDATHTSVLLLQQLLLGAEEWHLTLTANISELENREKLNVIKEYEENLNSGMSIRPSQQGKHVLPIEDFGAATALKQELLAVTLENQILKKKLEDLTKLQKTADENVESGNEAVLDEARAEIAALKMSLASSTGTAEELQAVQEGVEKMRNELRKSQVNAAEEATKLRKDLEAREDKLRSIQSNLLLAEKELEKKFQATAAYGNMKKILVAKNDTIKELREKVAEMEKSLKSEESKDRSDSEERSQEVED